MKCFALVLLFGVVLGTDVNPEFEPVIAALCGRMGFDVQAAKCATGCSKVVKEMADQGFSKLDSALGVTSFNGLPPDGAKANVQYIASSCSKITDPRLVEMLEGVLMSPRPLIYLSFLCGTGGECSYFFLVGQTNQGGDVPKTDLLVIKATASFEMAPRILVVRETNSSVYGTNVTDKIHEVPRDITKADVNVVFAFFEVEVVKTFLQPSQLPLLVQHAEWMTADPPTSAPKKAPVKPSPDMFGYMPTQVTDWNNMIKVVQDDKSMFADVLAGIAVGSIFGPVGVAIGGIIGLIPTIAKMFHTSCSHTDVIIGELQNNGFTKFLMDQSGPIYYHNLPFGLFIVGGQLYLLVNVIVNELFKVYLNDVPNESEQMDMQQYVFNLVYGWGDSNQIFDQGITYLQGKEGGTIKMVRFMTHVDQEAKTLSLLFWSTQATIAVAPRLIIHRVTDTSSNILHSDSSQKDVIEQILRVITTQDVLALYYFFDIMAAYLFAGPSAMGMCLDGNLQCSNVTCKLPDISGNMILVEMLPEMLLV